MAQTKNKQVAYNPTQDALNYIYSQNFQKNNSTPNTNSVSTSLLSAYGNPVNAANANGVNYQGAKTLNNITYDASGNRITDGSMNYAANGIDYQKPTGWLYGVPYNYRYNPVMDANTVYQQSIPDYMREAGIPDAQSLVDAYTDAANRTYQQELDALNYAELENQRTLEDLYRTQAQEQADNLANLKLNGGNAGAQFAQLALQQQANQEGLASQLTAAEEARRKLLDAYVSNVANAQVNAMNQYTTNALAAGQGRAADAYNNMSLAVGRDTANAQRYAADKNYEAIIKQLEKQQTTETDTATADANRAYLQTVLSKGAYDLAVKNGDLEVAVLALGTPYYNDEDNRNKLLKQLEDKFEKSLLEPEPTSGTPTDESNPKPETETKPETKSGSEIFNIQLIPDVVKAAASGSAEYTKAISNVQNVVNNPDKYLFNSYGNILNKDTGEIVGQYSTTPGANYIYDLSGTKICTFNPPKGVHYSPTSNDAKQKRFK